MAVLEDGRGARFTLAPQSLVGRAPQSCLRLEDARVSWDHARIVWIRDKWWLRDLNSTNGTWVDGRRLLASDRIELVIGQRLAFGNPQTAYRVVSIDSPQFRLHCLADGRIVAPTHALVGLPSDNEPLATLCLAPTGWSIEESGNLRTLRDQEIITVGEGQWRVERPSCLDEFAETGRQQPFPLADVKEMELALSVSADRETVTVWTTVDGRRHELPSRAHHELLLVLAEARLNEFREGVADSQAGWLDVEEAARHTAAGLAKLNLDIFRIRRAFENMGLREPHEIIERRASRRQIRIGTGRIQIQYRS